MRSSSTFIRRQPPKEPKQAAGPFPFTLFLYLGQCDPNALVTQLMLRTKRSIDR